MNEASRVLIATQDLQLRSMVEGLLRALRARTTHVLDERMLLAYLGTPEGFDLVVVDAAWEGLSVHAVQRACRARSRSLSETHVLVILPQGATSTEVIGAFNDGADFVVRQPLRPLEFLNACRVGERLTLLTRGRRSLDEADERLARTAPKTEAVPVTEVISLGLGR
ncbi:MAG TPA: response regulator [Candidatus Methylacidiphilales bacterium]